MFDITICCYLICIQTFNPTFCKVIGKLSIVCSSDKSQPTQLTYIKCLTVIVLLTTCFFHIFANWVLWVIIFGKHDENITIYHGYIQFRMEILLDNQNSRFTCIICEYDAIKLYSNEINMQTDKMNTFAPIYQQVVHICLTNIDKSR